MAHCSSDFVAVRCGQSVASMNGDAMTRSPRRAAAAACLTVHQGHRVVGSGIEAGRKFIAVEQRQSQVDAFDRALLERGAEVSPYLSVRSARCWRSALTHRAGGRRRLPHRKRLSQPGPFPKSLRRMSGGGLLNATTNGAMCARCHARSGGSRDRHASGSRRNTPARNYHRRATRVRLGSGAFRSRRIHQSDAGTAACQF